MSTRRARQKRWMRMGGDDSGLGWHVGQANGLPPLVMMSFRFHKLIRVADRTPDAQDSDAMLPAKVWLPMFVTTPATHPWTKWQVENALENVVREEKGVR